MSYRPNQEELDELNCLEVADGRETCTLDELESARILSDVMDNVLSPEEALRQASSPAVRVLVERDIANHDHFIRTMGRIRHSNQVRAERGEL
jgi:hypothetical protein